MNFETFTIQRFKVGVDYYKRTYQVFVSKSGKITVKNVLNGSILLWMVEPETIQINGEPMIFISDLQELVYNQRCVCDDEMDDGTWKIFDQTFDNTFE